MTTLPLHTKSPPSVPAPLVPAPLVPAPLVPIECSNQEYHQDPAISASHLKLIRQSPAEYFASYLAEDKPQRKETPSMRLGTMVHTAVLEPDTFTDRYAVLTASRTTKAGKEEHKAITEAGKEAISQSEYDQAMAMANSVFAHPAAAELLSAGQPELSYWWSDEETGLRCKCRPDWMQGSTIVDLKTTQDSSPEAFAKSCAHFSYHIQQAHYLKGLQTSEPAADDFVFIAVSSAFPYLTGVYRLDDAALIGGEDLRSRMMRKLKHCKDTGHWPGHSEAIESVSLPGWSFI